MRVFVSPNDGRADCECENCKKLYDPDGTRSSLVLHFTNLVAEEASRTYPDISIVYYVYDNYGTIPTHVRPHPNVSPEIVFWTLGSGTAANHAHPMMSDINHRYRDTFNWFADNSASLSVHTYYGHYNWFGPWPKLTQIENDIKTMSKRPNLNGMYSEIHRHWGASGIKCICLFEDDVGPFYRYGSAC